MGKHDKKTGKGRLDKFYKLAKEQGYRARSAFKLIHLNRKYDLLSKSKCVIDLCAAPGGWLQVAEKYMPKGSLIIGVDLAPIKPLPHVISFQADITTPFCRNQLRQHMHDWKADLVLHDGAPNVGSAWVQDAFTQNELVLQSLRLAVEFLRPGGHFVTKVFRSQDYNSLLWVFGQLFKTVEATKPPSSRNVSAEIFVVCQDFIAPKHIDPKFLDPKHVFKDVAPLPASITTVPEGEAADGQAPASTSTRLLTNDRAQANVFAPEKKRRQREGYAEGDFTNYHVARAEDFVRSIDPVVLLGSMNKIEFVSDEEKAWLKSRHTTGDVLENFKDLKVLGKGDFKLLMKWRLAIRLETGLDVKADPAAEATEEVTVEPMDEEEQITDELRKLHEEKLKKQKREKRRKNEIKTKTITKLQLGMTAPTDLDMDDRALAGEDVFDLGEGEREMSRSRVRSRGLAHAVGEHDGLSDDDEDEADVAEEEEEEDDEVFSSDEEREMRTAALEGELDGLYDEYKDRMAERDAKWRVKQERLKDRNLDSWHGIREDESDDGVDKGYRGGMVRVPRRGDPGSDDEGEESGEGGWDVVAASKARLDEADSSDEDSDDEERPKTSAPSRSTKAKQITTKAVAPSKATASAKVAKAGLVTSLQEPEKRAQMSRQAQLWFDQSVFRDVGDLAALDGDDEDEDEDEDDDEDEEMNEDEHEVEDEEEGEDDEDVEMASTLSSTLEGDEEDDDFEIVPADAEDNMPEWDVDDEDQDEVVQKQIKEKGLLTAEAVALATRLVNRQTTASKLIDDGFNRLSAHNKDGLPSWFLDDESKFYRPNLPITAEAVAALRDRQRALDARPIKKVAEAKARKKFKAHQRLERAKKKADGVMEADDLGDGEKARQVSKLLKKAAGADKRKPAPKIVVARGANRGVQGRPKGVKGKYKIVDPRMRKELRATKRIAKSQKKRRH